MRIFPATVVIMLLAGCSSHGQQQVRVMELPKAQVSYAEQPPVAEVQSGERKILIQATTPSVTRMAPTAGFPPPLEKTRWRLAGTALSSPVIPGQEPYLRIENGLLEGFSGCNRFNGGYQRQSNGIIRVTQVRISNLKCKGVEAQERAFVRGLMQTRRWSIAPPDILRFQDDPGQVVVEFRGMVGMP